MRSVWTSERTKSLVQLWSEGHSASEIGRRLDLSRSQVLGKIHRMKLHNRNPANSHKVPRKHVPEDVLMDCDYSLPSFILRSVY